jgi:phosphoribosylformylglycinamidine synthase
VGEIGIELGGSQFLKVCHGLKVGPPPQADLAHEIKIQNVVRDLIRAGLVKSAHDCSEGGLAVALAECCFNPDKLFGADVGVEMPVSGAENPRNAAGTATTTLFNESQSRIVISVAHSNIDKALSMLRGQNVPFQQLGKVGGDELRIQVGGQSFAWPVTEIHDDWWNAIRRLVESDTCAEGIPSL